MIGKISTVLLVAMLLVIQPVFAQDNVIILDLGYATDEELTGAMDASTELELIMRAEWELLDEDEAKAEEYPAEPEPVTEADYPAEEPALAAEAPELEYIVEEPVIAAEVLEPEYIVEEPIIAEEVPEPVYIVEEPVIAAEVPEPEYIDEEPVIAADIPEPEYIVEEPVIAEEVPEPEYIAEEPPADPLDNRYFQESQRLVRLAEEAYELGDYEAATAYAQEASRYAQLSDEYIAGHVGAEAVAERAATLPATFTVRSWAVYRDCLWNIAAHPDVFGDPLKWIVLFNANRHRMPNPNNPDLILPGMVLEIPSIDGEIREGAWQSR
ncbi:MAG: hypothetical protein FWB79_04745 [Treponema sp.]|nr:hypothetical protein [Treponema sp.]